jgi:hypothetical protein
MKNDWKSRIKKKQKKATKLAHHQNGRPLRQFWHRLESLCLPPDNNNCKWSWNRAVWKWGGYPNLSTTFTCNPQMARNQNASREKWTAACYSLFTLNCTSSCVLSRCRKSLGRQKLVASYYYDQILGPGGQENVSKEMLVYRSIKYFFITLFFYFFIFNLR